MWDQKSLSRFIKAREEAVNTVRESESVILSNLGQTLYGSPGQGEEETSPDEAPGRKDIDRISEDIQRNEDALRRLLSDEEKRKNLGEESKSLKVEIRNLNNRRESALEDLGRKCWELWKSGKQADSSLNEALTDLVKADDKLHTAEIAEFRNESDQGSRSSSFLKHSRALFLAGRRKTATAALDRLWVKAGRRILELVDSSSLSGTPASSPLSTLKVLDERLKEIADRSSAVDREYNEMDTLLEELPGKGNARKRITWLEDILAQANSSLELAYYEAGRTWVESNGDRKATGKIEKGRKDWKDLDERIKGLMCDIDAARQHQDYLKATEERDRSLEKISRIENEIKTRQSSLRESKKELARMEKDIASRSETLPDLPED